MSIVTHPDSLPDPELAHGIVIVSHSADRTGAPLIALNIARELTMARTIPIITILLEPGELAPEFAQLGPLFVARGRRYGDYHLDTRAWARLAKCAIYLVDSVWDDWFWRRIVKCLARRQIRYAMCNTVLSGAAAIRLKGAGVTSIGLIHELPHSIRANGWTDRAADLIQGVNALVFPCSRVQAAFAEAFSTDDKPSSVYPQGGNFDPDQLSVERRGADRLAFRARLGITCDDVLILGSGGSGDFRKGVDLFAHAAREMPIASKASATRKIVFAWAGHTGSSFREWAERDMVTLGISDRLVFLGPQQHMAPYFAAADIFFLTSREDPFPTTVLEAMAYSLPVVAFAGSGGVEEQIGGGVGVIVPYGDVTTAVKMLDRLAAQADERKRMGRLGQEKIALWGGYHTYVGKLIDLLLNSGSSKAS